MDDQKITQMFWWQPNGSLEDHPDVLMGAQKMIGGSPRCPGGSPVQVYTYTYMHTHTNIWGGRSWPSHGPPHYDRKPISFQIVLYEYNTIFTQCEDCTKIKNGFLSTNSSTNKKLINYSQGFM